MARVTVEDCIEVVNNRFELVLLAAQRARDISAGQSLLVDRDNDKNPVVALREIAAQQVDMDELKAHIVRGVNRQSDANSEDAELGNITQDGWPSLESLGLSSEFEEIGYDDGKEEATSEDAEEGDETLEAGAEEDTDPSDDEILADLADIDLDSDKAEA